MNPTWIEPPPRPKGMGCFGKGCLILVVFFVVLAVSLVIGTIYGARYLRTHYFPGTGVELPISAASEVEQQDARTKWYTFERKARAHTADRIELTAEELNALIASEPKLRGKAHVSIEGNNGRLQVSIPLEGVAWLKGRYLNAECSVQSAADGNPAGARITSIILNGTPVNDDAINLQYPPWSLRRYLSDWTEKNNLKTFEIRDGRVILETRGQ